MLHIFVITLCRDECCSCTYLTAAAPMQVGMRHFNIRKNKYHCPIVNLDKLWNLVGNEVRSCST